MMMAKGMSPMTRGRLLRQMHDKSNVAKHSNLALLPPHKRNQQHQQLHQQQQRGGPMMGKGRAGKPMMTHPTTPMHIESDMLMVQEDASMTLAAWAAQFPMTQSPSTIVSQCSGETEAVDGTQEGFTYCDAALLGKSVTWA